MGAISAFKRLLMEDYPTQRMWIGKLLDPINEFLEKVSQTLAGNVSVGANVACQVNTVTVTGNEVEFRWSRKDRPLGLLIVSCRNSANAVVVMPSVGWEYTASGTIKVTGLSTLAPTTSAFYTMTFITLAG